MMMVVAMMMVVVVVGGSFGRYLPRGAIRSAAQFHLRVYFLARVTSAPASQGMAVRENAYDAGSTRATRSRDHAAAVVPQLEALLLEVAPEDALREHDQLLESFQETPGKLLLKQVTCLWGCRERKRPAGSPQLLPAPPPPRDAPG